MRKQRIKAEKDAEARARASQPKAKRGVARSDGGILKEYESLKMDDFDPQVYADSDTNFYTTDKPSEVFDTLCSKVKDLKEIKVTPTLDKKKWKLQLAV